MHPFQKFINNISTDAKKSRTPITGVFELTGRCNFNCVMCYVHELDHEHALNSELSTQEWKDIFDSMISKGMLHAVLTGGECLLRNDFKELYLYLFSKGVKVSVNTNGYLIDTSYIDFFKKYPPVTIQITLYGSCNESYIKVTERPGFERVAKALSLITEVGIDLKVAITPCRELLPDFENIIKFLIEHKYSYSIGDYLIENKSGDALESDTVLTYEEILSLLELNARLNNRLSEPCPPLPEPFGPCSAVPDCGIKCSAGTCRAAIDWHGDLYSCYVLPLPKFNVLELGFDKAWELQGEEIAKVKAPVECAGCAYEKICNKCPAVRYDGLYSGHCNKDCCRATIDQCKLGIKKLPT